MKRAIKNDEFTHSSCPVTNQREYVICIDHMCQFNGIFTFICVYFGVCVYIYFINAIIKISFAAWLIFFIELKTASHPSIQTIEFTFIAFLTLTYNLNNMNVWTTDAYHGRNGTNVLFNIFYVTFCTIQKSFHQHL